MVIFNFGFYQKIKRKQFICRFLFVWSGGVSSLNLWLIFKVNKKLWQCCWSMFPRKGNCKWKSRSGRFFWIKLGMKYSEFIHCYYVCLLNNFVTSALWFQVSEAMTCVFNKVTVCQGWTGAWCLPKCRCTCCAY